MAVLITEIEKNSLAERKTVNAGDFLLAVNGHLITDVLDYRFYLQEDITDLALRTQDGKHRLIRICKNEYDDIGLCFESYLMDEQRVCRNKCVFCFIDQLPKGLRESLYFKDDDARLSFLFGNYITLTNLSEREIQRIIEMHISPVNLSIHTMNPDLRMRMMGNPAAGDCLQVLQDFAAAGIKLNIQLVLCPGINDGDELRYSLNEIKKLGFSAVQSVAAVPVGLTRHRKGLPKLLPYTAGGACEVLRILDEFNAGLPESLAFAADEFYIKAEVPIPAFEHYGELHQLENGVGMSALFKDEFTIHNSQFTIINSSCTVVTGKAAYPLISELCAKLSSIINVIAVTNRLLGDGVTVVGLLCGADIIHALRGVDLGERVLIPSSIFNRDGVTLDDMTVRDIEIKLDVPVIVVPVDGGALVKDLRMDE